MKRIAILLAFAVCLSFIKVWAVERHLAVPDITIPSGGTVDFQIDLEDDEVYTICFNSDLEIPDGFSFVPQDNDPTTPFFTVNYARQRNAVFGASYPGRGKWDENDIRFIYYSTDNGIISDAAGWIVKFRLTTTAAPGVYEAKLFDINITDKAFHEIDQEDLIVKITVTEPEEIRYTENQLFCNDIEVNQGENAELKLSYNSTSDIYEYSASVVLPSGVQPLGNVTFTEVLTSIDNFTNNSSWDANTSELKISGEYGGRRADPAPSGKKEFATVSLNTSTLVPGEYQIKVTNQVLSNDDDDYTPEEYIGYIIVKAKAEAERCSPPTITIDGNRLIVHSDTDGATYHTTITAQDHQEVTHAEGKHIELTGQYLVTSYASAEGYSDSEPVTATLIWNKTEDISTGVDDILMETNRMILLQSVGNTLVIHGVKHSESIYLYDLPGTLLYQGSADYNPYSIPYECESGKLYIVKVGSDTIKYIF